MKEQTVSIPNYENLTQIFEFQDGQFQKGKMGFMTDKSLKARFDNIKFSS